MYQVFTANMIHHFTATMYQVFTANMIHLFTARMYHLVPKGETRIKERMMQ